jgi:hypothetical protein
MQILNSLTHNIHIYAMKGSLEKSFDYGAKHGI